MDSRDELLKAVAQIADVVDDMPDNASLGSWIIVYEVNFATSAEDGHTQICYSAQDARAWIQKGLLAEGHGAVDMNAKARAILEDDEHEGDEE